MAKSRVHDLYKSIPEDKRKDALLIALEALDNIATINDSDLVRYCRKADSLSLDALVNIETL